MNKIAESDLKALLSNAEESKTGIARINYHESCQSDMQIMLIAFKANKTYNYIRDNCRGKMLYICMFGSISLQVKEPQEGNKVSSFKLIPGESIVINRNNWRSTISGHQGAVFLECVEGKYDQKKREHMKTHPVNK